MCFGNVSQIVLTLSSLILKKGYKIFLKFVKKNPTIKHNIELQGKIGNPFMTKKLPYFYL